MRRYVNFVALVALLAVVAWWAMRFR